LASMPCMDRARPPPCLPLCCFFNWSFESFQKGI
jgi:hypothetical protein